MANIKWSGIESWKYGLTARWYVSAFYGNDVDVDGAGYYNPSTNPTGHGGPLRPFGSRDKVMQNSNVTTSSVVVYDSGYYTSSIYSKLLNEVGDGVVTFSLTHNNSLYLYNIQLLNYSAALNSYANSFIDCNISFCSNLSFFNKVGQLIGCNVTETTFYHFSPSIIANCTFIRCSSGVSIALRILKNAIFIECNNLMLSTDLDRAAGTYCDYSIIIGTVKSARAINGKTSGITIEDFKIDGKYFVKSFSEVDLFGNVSGSGASVAQLKTIFNNYFSPIYLDTYMYADFSLKTTANEKVKFGGLNGTYIGMRPVGYHYDSAALWANRNVGNTSNIEVDAVTGYLQIVSGQEFGTYESNEIDLGVSIIVDPVLFCANLVYNADGTAKQGVANQRIDTNPDATPDNTLNQRVVYDYQFAWSPDNVAPLSAFKNFELNRKPTVDSGGDTQLDDNFTVSEQTYITVRRFKIRFTLRKIVIE